jgi:hypothetical protein
MAGVEHLHDQLGVVGCRGPAVRWPGDPARIEQQPDGLGPPPLAPVLSVVATHEQLIAAIDPFPADRGQFGRKAVADPAAAVLGKHPRVVEPSHPLPLALDLGDQDDGLRLEPAQRERVGLLHGEGHAPAGGHGRIPFDFDQSGGFAGFGRADHQARRARLHQQLAEPPSLSETLISLSVIGHDSGWLQVFPEPAGGGKWPPLRGSQRAAAAALRWLATKSAISPIMRVNWKSLGV